MVETNGHALNEYELETDHKNDEEIEKEIDKGFLNSSDVKWLRGANRVKSQVSLVEFNKI